MQLEWHHHPEENYHNTFQCIRHTHYSQLFKEGACSCFWLYRFASPLQWIRAPVASPSHKHWMLSVLSGVTGIAVNYSCFNLYMIWFHMLIYHLYDGIPVELFQILKYDAVKVLHSICQKIWKTQQWPQDWKRSVFNPSPKKAMPKNAQATAQLRSSHTKWQPTPCSCLENPRDGGAWWAAVYGVAQSWTRLKWLSGSSSTR